MKCQGCPFVSATYAPSKDDLVEELNTIEEEHVKAAATRKDALHRLAAVWLARGNGKAGDIMPTACSAHLRQEIAAHAIGEAGKLISDDAGNLVTPFEVAARSVHRQQAAGLLGAAAGPGVEAAKAASQLKIQGELLPRRRLETALFSKCRRCIGAARSGLLHKPSLQPLHGDSSSVLAGHARHQKHVPIASILPGVQFTDACAVQQQPPEFPPAECRGLGVAADGRLCAGRLDFGVQGGPSLEALRHALPSVSPLVARCVSRAASSTDERCALVVDIVLFNALRQPVLVTVGGEPVSDLPAVVARFQCAWRPAPGAAGKVAMQLEGNDGMGTAVDVPAWPRADSPTEDAAACILWQQAHWACVRLCISGPGVASALSAAKAAKEGPRLRNFHPSPADHVVVHLTVPLRVQLPAESWVAEDAVAAGSAASVTEALCETNLVCPVHVPLLGGDDAFQ